jgi:DNA-directed RNA polymerase subunit RPC12/RpoP
MQCPSCNSKRFAKTATSGVYQCVKCEAIFGTCTKGDSYNIVLPYFAKTEPSAESLRYYDLTVLGSDGITRRHGWFNPQTKLISQVG